MKSDRTEVRVNIQDLPAIADANRLEVSIKPLFKSEREEVRLEEWQGNRKVAIDAPGGAELLVLEGSFTQGQDEFLPQS